MSDEIRVQLSAPPWLAAEGTDLVEVFNHYDFPRVGLLRQEGNLYLFMCLDEFKDLGLWVYVLIDPSDVDRLRESADFALAYLSRTTRAITVVSSRDERIEIISSYEPLGRTVSESALLSVERALEELTEEAGAGRPVQDVALEA